MAKQPEPFLFLETLGCPAPEGDKEGDLDVLRWLKQYGTPPTFAEDTEPEKIFQRGYLATPEPEWRNIVGHLGADLNVPWALPEETRVDFDLDTFKNFTQRAIRVVVHTNTYLTKNVKIEDYNPLAVEMHKLAIALHQKMEAKLTVVDYTTKLLAPYNLKTLPLWIGWSTIVGKEVADKYKLAEKLSELPASITVEKQGSDLIFTSTQPYSEYVLNGWDEKAKTFWGKAGGKLLLPKGKKHSRSSRKKDGETYIVNTDERGQAVLNRFNLPGT